MQEEIYKMFNFPGAPGTWTALILRILQSIFAAGSLVLVATIINVDRDTSFFYLIPVMEEQLFLSFGLSISAAIAIYMKRTFHNHKRVQFFFLSGDMVMFIVTCAAATYSATSVYLLYLDDSAACSVKYMMAIAFAILSWVASNISFIMFLIFAKIH